MLKFIALALILITTSAEAHIGKHYHPSASIHTVAGDNNFVVATGSIAQIAGRYLGGNPTGWAHQWCGRFLSMVVQQAGYKLPAGPNLARDWVHFGRPASPQPGAVMVMPNHVGIVLAVKGTKVVLRSGNHGHRVADGIYDIRRAIAWRMP